MTDLRTLALHHIPSALRSDAEQVAGLLEEGYRPGEVATLTGLNRQRVREFQTMLRDGMVRALEADGYTPIETIRYLGVPTAMVHAHMEEEPA